MRASEFHTTFKDKELYLFYLFIYSLFLIDSPVLESDPGIGPLWDLFIHLCYYTLWPAEGRKHSEELHLTLSLGGLELKRPDRSKQLITRRRVMWPHLPLFEGCAGKP